MSGPEEARNQAVTACGEALKDLDGEFWESEEWTMTVKDWQGNVVCELKFSGTRSAACLSLRLRRLRSL